MVNTDLRLKVISFVMEPSLLAQVDARAKQESRSRSWMLRHLIRSGLGRTPSPDQPVRELKAEPAEEGA